MLTLPIKKKWFDMIISGEKKEEYRAINDYYTVRFMNLFGTDWCNRVLFRCSRVLPGDDKMIRKICFRNGYSSASPSIIADCALRIGIGNPNWGAENDVRYFILKISKVERGENNV